MERALALGISQVWLYPPISPLPVMDTPVEEDACVFPQTLPAISYTKANALINVLIKSPELWVLTRVKR